MMVMESLGLEVMEEAVATLPLDEIFKQGMEVVRPIFLKLSLIVGGIFGLYFILILIRIHYERKKVKLLKDIRYDLDNISKHLGVHNSVEKRHRLRELFTYLKNRKIKRKKK